MAVTKKMYLRLLKVLNSKGLQPQMRLSLRSQGEQCDCAEVPQGIL
jgi:hypothetical protein